MGGNDLSSQQGGEVQQIPVLAQKTRVGESLAVLQLRETFPGGPIDILAGGQGLRQQISFRLLYLIRKIVIL